MCLAILSARQGVIWSNDSGSVSNLQCFK